MTIVLFEWHRRSQLALLSFCVPSLEISMRELCVKFAYHANLILTKNQCKLRFKSDLIVKIRLRKKETITMNWNDQNITIKLAPKPKQ